MAPRRFLRGPVVALVGLLCARMASAQSPIEGEILANATRTEGYQYLLSLACDGAGDCGVIWDAPRFEGPPPDQEGELFVTGLTAAGGDRIETLLRPEIVTRLSLVSFEDGWSLFWDQRYFEGLTLRERPVMQRFSREFIAAGEVSVLEQPGLGFSGIFDAAVLPSGFVVLQIATDPDQSDGTFLGLVDNEGQSTGDVRVNDSTPGAQLPFLGGLAVGGDGTITAVYQDDPGTYEQPSENGFDIRVRRFAPSGDPLGPSTVVNRFVSGNQAEAVVASSATGSSVVAWHSDSQDGSFLGVYAQRFNAKGKRVGPEFRVNQVTFSDQRFAQVAMDKQGNFLVVWESFDPAPLPGNLWDIKARLYRANGQPAGPEINVNQHRILEQTAPRVAFAGNGIFLVGWESNSQLSNDSDHDVFVRRLSASSGDEPCVASAGLLRCDTGRSGDALEITHPFGTAPEGPFLLGDIDGDGRADPCEWKANRFRCDTDHEGGVAEVRIAVPGGGVPLLGDVDGDGRADPCLFSATATKGGRFACDTAHNGGTAEAVIRFGKVGDTPLFGDLDGDGKDDPCAFSITATGGRFRCDTKHNGGAAEVLIAFGQAGDQALLGDFDGDGDDDPCVYRAGQLLCDTAHDGGDAEGSLTFGEPGDFVVLGNLDGL